MEGCDIQEDMEGCDIQEDSERSYWPIRLSQVSKSSIIMTWNLIN